jgi:hypothetical protein
MRDVIRRRKGGNRFCDSGEMTSIRVPQNKYVRATKVSSG